MMPKASYSRRLRWTTLLAFLALAAIALPLGYALRLVAPGEDFWPVLTAGLLIVGLTLWACVPWWRTMDGMQKHGHMISWYWGGMGGGLAVMAWLIAAIGLRREQVQGALALFMGQAAGFLMFWIVWSWRRRGLAE